MISRKHKKTPPTSIKYQPGFIFILNNAVSDALDLINESIEKMKKDYIPLSSFYIISDTPSEIKSKIADREYVTFLSHDESLSIFSEHANKNFFLWNEAEKITSLINFNEFFRQDFSWPNESEYCEIDWKTQPLNISPGLIFAPATLRYIFSCIKESSGNFIKDFHFYIRALRLKKKPNFQVNSDCPFSPSKKFNFKPGIREYFKRSYFWNIKTSAYGTPGLNFIKEPPVSRLIFFIIAALIFILLPVISFNAGISGDEEKHYMHAEKVYNYFATSGKDTSALHDPQLKLNYYGQSFDLMTFLVVKMLNTQKIYEVRHIMNGAIGALAIITAGVLAKYLAGSLAGILTMLFMFLSPRFLGHAMNNPMDIPFALGYIFTILQIIRFLDRLPRFSYSIAALIALGISFTISIRIGGLLLIPYLFMFSGLFLLIRRWPWETFSKEWIRFAGRGLLFLLVISVLGYFLSLIPWPYGLKDPVKNPMEALRMMSNIEVSLRVFFNGAIHWSDKLPWFYIPKFVLISIPVIVLAGFAMSLFLINRWAKLSHPYWFFVLLFATVFPVFYVIYKGSNVYGGWRHLLFIYPSLAILSTFSFTILYEAFNKKYLKIALGVILLVSLISPASHIIRNYPNQYIYFNQLVGGVNKAFKNYETDYYLVSLKTGTDWLKENVIEPARSETGKPLRIISNAPNLIMQDYFKDYLDIVETPYTRYYDRGIYDWDYAIFFCNYIEPFQIRKGIWPPKNTVFTVNVDNVPVCAVIKREDKNDFEGSTALSRGIAERDIFLINQGLDQLETAAKYDPNNEVVWLNLATGYIMLQKYDLARQKLNRLLEIYPQYDKALGTIGYSYISEGESQRDVLKIDMAITYLNEAVKVNYKHSTSYYYLGLAYYFKKDYQTALKHLQSAIDFSPRFKDPYALAATIFEESGQPREAARWREYLQNL